MTKRNLVLLGWLALTFGVGGCTQKIAKMDSPAPADNQTPTETAAAPAAPAQDAPTTPAAEVVAAADAPAQEAVTPPAPEASAAAAPSAAPQDTAAAPAAQAAVTAKADQNATTAKPEQDTAKAASSLPLPPQEVAEAIKKLTHSPRARYLSRTAQYDYYVGGRLDAKFGLNDNQLIVTNDGGGDQVKCEYSNDGKMISDGKSSPELIGACNTLINELGDYLSR